MKERYIVTLYKDDYERVREHTEDGFETYDQALFYAKNHSKCVENGRRVSNTATIYRVIEVTSVYQHKKTQNYIIEKEE